MKRAGQKLIAIVSLCVSFSALASSPGQALKQLFEQEWQMRLKQSPLLATDVGEARYNHLLDQVTETNFARWGSATEGFLKKLSKIDFNALSTQDKVNYQIFKAQLTQRLNDLHFKSYQIPFTSDSGFHTEIMRLPEQQPLRNELDFNNYLSRLQQIPRYFEQHKANMRAGLARGFSMPRLVMAGFSEVLENAYLPGREASGFWRPFKQRPVNIEPRKWLKLKASAKVIITEEVMPAFKSLQRFFDQEYIPASRDSLGASELPDGSAFYAAQIARYTTLELDAEEIHQIGINEITRIRGEMEDIIKQLGYSGSFREFVEHLRSSPRFYAKTATELLKEASYIAKKMDGQLPRLFTRLPRQPYAVEPVPESIAPKYTTGRYLSAPINSERAGTYWVNTYALDKRPLYVLEALTLYEAVPGHHLQNALNQELNELPEFRRHSYISAFGEGWGLYSERLGLEVGFYQDPYSNFGRLTYEMWRAARLVIDTGIHTKGWSREQAIELLENNSALSTHNIRTEVDRYISWPGQALSYKLGELKIRELRAKAEKRLAGKFDIRLFHDAILKNGSVPLPVLEQQIEGYIEAQAVRLKD